MRELCVKSLFGHQSVDEQRVFSNDAIMMCMELCREGTIVTKTVLG
jgi:hypothetical protein